MRSFSQSFAVGGASVPRAGRAGCQTAGNGFDRGALAGTAATARGLLRSLDYKCVITGRAGL
jgi:hypothetical protein